MRDEAAMVGRVSHLQESTPSLFQDEPRLQAWPPRSSGVARVDPAKVPLRRELLQALPGPLLRMHGALPMELHQDTLILGMEDPYDLAVQETIRRLTGWEVLPVQLCADGGSLPSWSELQKNQLEPRHGKHFELERTFLEAKVVGPLAWVRLTQTYRNISALATESVYLVPLPHSAVHQGLWVDQGGRSMAPGPTQRIVRGGRLHLSARIGPVNPNDSLCLTFSYVHLLERDARGFRIQLPCPAGEAEFEAHIQFQVDGLEPEQIRCTQPACWQRLPAGPMQVSLKRDPNRSRSDLVCHYCVPDRILEGLLLSDGQHFMLQLRPSPPHAASPPRDLLFLLDHSASLEGWVLEQGRRAVLHCLGRLRPLDRYSLAVFDDQVVSWQESRRVGSGSLSAAQNWLHCQTQGGGTTNLVGALEWLFEQARLNQTDRPLYAVLISDGQGGRQAEACRIASALRGSLRLFTLGIGPGCQEHFLGRLASLAGGSSEIASSSQDLTIAMERLCLQIGPPVCSQIRLVGQGFHSDPAQQHPTRLPDLFSGQNFTLVGKHQGIGPLRATGVGPDGPTSLILTPTMTDHPALASLWAKAQLEGLQRKLGQAATEKRNAVVDQMRQLRVGYQLDDSYAKKLLTPDSWPHGREIRPGNRFSLADAVVEQAVMREASHIHVETQGSTVKIRLRICGRLYAFEAVSDQGESLSLIGQFKQWCRLTSVVSHFQTGRFERDCKGQSYCFEVSFCPTINGEKVVIESRPAQLRSHRALAEPGRSAIENLLTRRRGLLLICGPKGSGGNSLMVDWLGSLFAERHALLCHKEEWFGLRGVTQLVPGAELATLLNDLEGHDIDVLACTRTREKEAWEALTRRASERSLVLARHHARSAAASLVDLVEQGVDGRRLAKCLLGAISLRKLPRLCECRIPAHDPALLAALPPSRTSAYSAPGSCQKCLGSGFFGSVLCTELLLYRPEIFAVLRPGLNSRQVEQGLIRYPMEQQVLRLAQQGVIEAKNCLEIDSTF